MKITSAIAIIPIVLIAAGCTYEERHPGYTSSSTYGQTVISSPPYATNSYSATAGSSTYDSSYSTGAAAATVQALSESDQNLAAQVRSTLNNDTTVSRYAENVGVNAQSGAVTLTGSVPNERVRQNIDSIVREISGVTTVYDQMRILPQATSSSSVNSRVYSESAPVPYNEAAGNIFSLHVQGLNEPDRSMAQRILQELRTDTILQTLLPSVNITVSGGQVVLQGRVQSEQQKRSIYSAVQRATGGNVRNELVVAR